jgi:hypothetical protein
MQKIVIVLLLLRICPVHTVLHLSLPVKESLLVLSEHFQEIEQTTVLAARLLVFIQTIEDYIRVVNTIILEHLASERVVLL